MRIMNEYVRNITVMTFYIVIPQNQIIYSTVRVLRGLWLNRQPVRMRSPGIGTTNLVRTASTIPYQRSRRKSSRNGLGKESGL